MLIDIYLKPIRNLNFGVLVSDLSEQYDFENFNWPETQRELYDRKVELEALFEIVAPLVWGISDDPWLSISKQVRDSDGIVTDVYTLEDVDAVIALMSTYMLMHPRRV